MSKTRPFGSNRCPNCGEYEAHYCPPSMGEEGFFICKPKNKTIYLEEIKRKKEKKERLAAIERLLKYAKDYWGKP